MNNWEIELIDGGDFEVVYTKANLKPIKPAGLE